jgi:hypothetical protein
MEETNAITIRSREQFSSGLSLMEKSKNFSYLLNFLLSFISFRLGPEQGMNL